MIKFHTSKELRKSKTEVKTMDRYLRFVLMSTIIFTLAMIALYIFTGGYPEILTQMWFTYVLGECGVMGLIKCSKEISAAKEEKAAKEAEAKKAMSAMAAAEEEAKANGKDNSSK